MERTEDAPRYGRRTFLGLVAGGVSALWWGPAAVRVGQDLLLPVSQVLPSGVRELLPVGGWRIYTISGSLPPVDRATWRLRIDGLVERPVELSYEDVLRLPRAEQVSTFHCVTGWTVKNVRWAGVRFADLLALARPLPAAHALRFESAEVPYVDSLTLAQAALPDAMLAYGMDGKPLSRAHGAPARVVIPDMYGYKNVKWVRRIELVDAPFDGYWEQRGYDRDAWVR
jgi:DMSO/TMAO reductase YedYZ molybdopterin-dependent catalytic subunit